MGVAPGCQCFTSWLELCLDQHTFFIRLWRKTRKDMDRMFPAERLRQVQPFNHKSVAHPDPSNVPDSWVLITNRELLEMLAAAWRQTMLPASAEAEDV